MRSKLVFALLVLCTGSFARAQPRAGEPDPARTLDVAAQAIDRTLKDADAAVARAAADVAATGIRGPRTQARLELLCRELSYAGSCVTMDASGVIVSVAPAAFSGVVGQNVRDQAHVQRMLLTRRPILSGAFRAVEGFDAVVLAHPVSGADGRFLGSVSVVARTGSLIGHAVKPVVPAGEPELFVMQRDGYLLYDADPEEIGRNIFTDPMYRDFTDLLQVARRAAAVRSGTGEYTFLGRGLTAPVQKRVRWTTVGLHGTEWRACVTGSLEGGGPPVTRHEAPALPIPGEIGLESLIALSDGHLSGIAEDLGLVAAGADVQSGQWARIEHALRRVSDVNVPGVYWYARPDGSYWSLDEGPIPASLSDRSYFRDALAGKQVIGDLVVSKSTGRTTGIVAVPVKGEDGQVRGVLGASVYLDQLSARIREEMGLDEGIWFYAFDQEQRLALHPDPERLFLRSGELGPEVERWFTEMQSRQEGEIRYRYEGTERTLVFRRSPVTGWFYAFGFVGERAREPRAEAPRSGPR